jgi:acid phosphatase
MRRTIQTMFLFAFLFVFFNRVASQPPLVVNLSEAKKAIKEYYLSGQYSLELDTIIADAIRQLNSLQIGKNSAFVFDVDETALSNFEYEMKYDFGYIKSEWDKWVETEKAVPIRQVKAFYDTLVSRGIKIIFITGRSQSQYQATFNNLKKAGYGTFDTLICRGTNETNLTAREFKSLKRKELTEKGYKIIGSIGDQWSDLEGGYTILKVKIPNYMYKVE